MPTYDDGSSNTLTADTHPPAVSYMCMADDNGRSAVDEDLCGSLKVGGGVSRWSLRQQRG